MAEVIDSFHAVAERAQARSSALLPLLAQCWTYFETVQKQALEMIEIARELKPALSTILLAYSGEQSNYDDWAALRTTDIDAITLRELESPQAFGVVCTELIWRIYERSLGPETPDETVDWFESRLASLANPASLLIECYLNRFTMLRSATKVIDIVVDSEHAIHIMRQFGVEGEAIDGTEAQTEQLAFLLFDTLLFRYTPSLTDKRRAAQVAHLLNARLEELQRFRVAVRATAGGLVSTSKEGGNMEAAVALAVEQLGDEVAAVADLDRNARQRLISAVQEDSTFWATAGSLVAYLLNSLPGMVPAALALSVFSSLGAGALRIKHERDKLLSTSPWSFAYYLARDARGG